MSARFRLARLSLFTVVVAPALTACFDAPPEYSVPKPVPPVVLTGLVDPVTTEVVPVPADHDVDFTVPFRSDDLGEDLTAFFVWDIPKGAADYQHVADSVSQAKDPDLAASDVPFADQGTARAVRYSWAAQQWKVQAGEGCHRMTMILSHTTNFVRAYDLEDSLAAAQVTWFLALGATSNSCGSVTGTTTQ